MISQTRRKKIVDAYSVIRFVPWCREKKKIESFWVILFVPRMETRKPFYALVCDPFSFQTRRKKLMPLCVILFVRGRGEKTQFDAFMYYTFCSLTRLLPDAEKKIDAFFVPGHIEKKLLLFLCVTIYVPRPERRKIVWCSCVWSFLFQDRRKPSWCSCVWSFLFPDAEKKNNVFFSRTHKEELLLLLCVILFVLRPERRKTFWCSCVWSFLFSTGER